MVAVTVVMMVCRLVKELPGLPVSGVGKYSVFHVSAENALLCEGGRKVSRVDPPAIHSAEKERAIIALDNSLV